MRNNDGKEQFVLENIDKMKRAELIAKAGVSRSRFYSILRRHGIYIAPKTKQKRILEREAAPPPPMAYEMAELYKLYSQSEIANMLGVSKRVVGYWTNRLGAQHSEEGWTRIRNKLAEAQKHRTAESFRKMVETSRQLRRADEIRVMAGLQQKTRYKLKRDSKRVQSARYRLKHDWNYYQDEEDRYLFYWDGDTRRIPNEQEWARKYGFCIEQGDDDNNDDLGDNLDA